MHFFSLQNLALVVLSCHACIADYITITSPAENVTICPGQQLAVNLKVIRADLAVIEKVNVRLLDAKQDTLWEIQYPRAGTQGEWQEGFTWPVRSDLAQGEYTINAYSNASYFNGKGRSFITRETNLTLTLINSTSSGVN